jgi:hypothetical protein
VDSRLQKLFDWFGSHAKTLDLLPEYARSVYGQWNDYFWGEIPVAPIVLWYLLGNPPMWVTIPAFFWAFLIAGYYVWRKDHAAVPHFSCWISDMIIVGSRVFVGLKIINVGPPASIPIWQAIYRTSSGKGIGLSDRSLLEDANITAPLGIHGENLRRDLRILATGETREGWIAFDTIGPSSTDDQLNVIHTLSLQFTDAFGYQHEISTLPASTRKIKS